MESSSVVIWLLCGIWVVSSFEIDPLIYLHKYGYAKPGRSIGRGLKEAIKTFQRNMHIPTTGKLDNATKAMMQKSRCGVPDDEDKKLVASRVRRYAESTNFWNSRQLTYSYENYSPDLGEAKTREAIERAFALWSAVTKLYFKEVRTGTADIMIRFNNGKHGCHYPFDGPGGVLAHAFYPENGDAHFDEDEKFTLGTTEGVNLFIVAAHEFGHAFGLPHSTVWGSLMYPIYSGYIPNFQLPADDIGAIQALYGCKEVQSVASYPRATASANGILYEQWNMLDSDNVDQLRPLTCRYPHKPNDVTVLQTSKGKENAGEDTGARMRGYYIAEQSGYYTFYLSANNKAELWMSESVDPAGKTKVAEVKEATKNVLERENPNTGYKYLEADKKYYFEALQKSKDTKSHLIIGVQEPGMTEIKVLTAEDTQWMVTDEPVRVMLCSGRYEPLHCPHGYKVEIMKAAYGRKSEQERFIHELCTQSKDIRHYSDHVAENSLTKTREVCNGKQACLLHASREVYGDAEGRNHHHVLDVTYRCVTELGPQPTPPIPSTGSPGGCQDDPREGVYCGYYKDKGQCSDEHIKKKKCPLTCGYCKGSTKPTCSDDVITGAAKSCNSWKSAGYCRSQEDSMRMYCRKTCGFCCVLKIVPPEFEASSCLACCLDFGPNRGLTPKQLSCLCKKNVYTLHFPDEEFVANSKRSQGKCHRASQHIILHLQVRV